MAITPVSQRVAAFRARKKSAGMIELRGIFVPARHQEEIAKHLRAWLAEKYPETEQKKEN